MILRNATQRNATPKPLLAIVFAAVSLCAAPSYAENPSTWKDPKTGLTWQRCSLGQTWNGYDCDGTPLKYTFDQAQEAVKALGRGWRVPAVSELASLIRCNTGFQGTGELTDRRGGMKTMPLGCNDGATRPTIDTTIFPNTPDHLYWSASPHADYLTYAWYVDFNYGNSNISLKGVNYHVRAVRASH